jgi:glycosyltransferase involved in cell wall biosynthesis
MSEHIVQVVQHLRPGGIECMVLDLARRASVPSTIVALEGARADTLATWPVLQPLADRLVFLDKPTGSSPRTVWRLARLLRRLNATAVHTHHIGPLLYGGIAARLARIDRRVQTEHDAWHLEAPRRRVLEAGLLSLVRPTLVADSAMVARAMHNALGARPILTIDNGIDTDRFVPADRIAARQALNLPVTATVVGAAARLETVKGIDLLIEAMPRHSRLMLAIAGDGSQRAALELRVASLGLTDRVRFLGRIDAMETFYPALDRFCLPSRHEGLPLSLLEAQACGIPAVVTPVGAMADAIDPTTGVVADAVSADALADALERSLRAVRTPSPRDRIVGRFSLTAMITAYEELWHDRSDRRVPHLAPA